MTWAELLKRTFAFDVLHCEQCGSRARVVSAITQRAVIDKILAHFDAAGSGYPHTLVPLLSIRRLAMRSSSRFRHTPFTLLSQSR